MSIRIIAIALILASAFLPSSYAQGRGTNCSLYPVKFTNKGSKQGGYINREGRLIVPPIFSHEVGPFLDGIAVAKANDPLRFSLVHCDGRVVAVENASIIEYFSEGLAFAQVGGRNVFINGHGEAVITLPSSLELDEDAPLAFGFKNGVAGLNARSGLFHVDRTGKLSKRKGVLTSSGYLGKTESVLLKLGYTIIDENGTPLAPFEKTPYEFSDDDSWFRVKAGGKTWKYFDEHGTERLVVPFEYSGTFSHGLSPILHNGKWGFINKFGQVIIPAVYEGATGFSDDGVAAVRVGEKVGIINPAGKFIIEPSLAEVGEFHDGLIWAQEMRDVKGGAWGYVDLKGKWIWKDDSLTGNP